MKAKVAERGQVTIPQEIREKLGIKPGTVLEFEVHNSKLVAVKSVVMDPVDDVYGCLENRSLRTDDVLRSLRGDL